MSRLRVALVAGTLGQGGAEKQLVYIAKALQEVGVDVRVYCLTKGEFYEKHLKMVGIEPIWVGRFHNPLARLSILSLALLRFRPHIVQAIHSFTNLYAAGAAKLCGAISIGSVRGDVQFELKENGKWGPWLFRLPSALVANSTVGARRAAGFGNSRKPVRILLNAIDLAEVDRNLAHERSEATNDPEQVLMVGHLIQAKRVDRFLAALARARNVRPRLRGLIVGDGSLLPELESLADKLGLSNDGVIFTGRRNDVPKLLKQSSMLVSTSDHEGFSNVLLEGMAARLPVVTTPAGDAAQVIQDGQTGYVVDFEDIDGLADRIVQLADSQELRRKFGEAGRKRVEENFDVRGLGAKVLTIYRSIAQDAGRRDLGSRVASTMGAVVPKEETA